MLDLNPLPPTYYTAPEAPSGAAEVKRLSRALNDRAAALADAIRADLRGRTAEMAVNLSTAVDAFDDGVDINVTPVIARNGFATVDAMTLDLRRMLQGQTLTPRVQAALQSYLATYVLLRQALGMPNPPEILTGTALAAPGTSRIVALSDRFLEQINAFINVFALNVGTVPEGNVWLADAQRLQTAAAEFRQDAARGLTPGQIAFEFRDVDCALAAARPPDQSGRPELGRPRHRAGRPDGPDPRRDPRPARHARLPGARHRPRRGAGTAVSDRIKSPHFNINI